MMLIRNGIALLVTFFYFAVAADHSVAKWREGIGVFRIGMVTSTNSEVVREHIEPFKQVVSNALDMDVDFFISPDVSTILDALKNDHIEYAILSATAYSLANGTCRCIEPLVIPRASDSSDSYFLIAITRSEDKLTVDDFAGKRLARLSEDSIIGEKILSYLFSKDYPLFDQSIFDFRTGITSSQTEAAFIAGDYDVLFGWSSLSGEPSKGFSRGTLRRLVDKFSVSGADFDVLWKSPPIPHRVHVVRKKIDGEAKSLLRDLMTSLYQGNPVAYDAIEPVYSGGFTSSRASSFKPFDEFFESLGEKRKVKTPK